jgi:hypothetical protein
MQEVHGLGTTVAAFAMHNNFTAGVEFMNALGQIAQRN